MNIRIGGRLFVSCIEKTAIFSIITLSVNLAYAQPNLNVVERIESQGVVIEFALQNIEKHKSQIVSGDIARFQFFAHDSTNGSPISGSYPAAWVHPKTSSMQQTDDEYCQSKTRHFLGSGLFSKAEIDLNVYYVITLNDDATLSVVDPLFGFGGSKLLAMVPLSAPGYDWTKDAKQTHIYVSVPATHEIVKINTLNWEKQILAGNIPTDTKKYKTPISKFRWKNPRRLVMPHDQNYLWVGVQQGIAIIDTQTFSLRKILPISESVDEIKFSNDGHYAYVMSKATNTLYWIDAVNLKLLKSLPINHQLESMDYSSLAEAIYISTGNGSVKVVDARTFELVQEIKTELGLGMVRVAPGGRWVYLINPNTDRLSIIDSSKNRIIQSAILDKTPISINFSDELAYIIHKDSSTILMITMADENIGKENAVIPSVDTPGGDHAPIALMPTPADGIVQAPGSNAVLIANYKDQAVYFFKEGMAAPMGQFTNYGRSPRAVMTIDRSLKEMEHAGVYESVAKLSKPGAYDVVFFMDNPRIVHCFTLNVAAKDIERNNKDINTPLFRQAHGTTPDLMVDTPAELTFRVKDQGDFDQQHDYYAVVSLASGLWRNKKRLRPDSQGNLLLQFIPPMVGYYRVSLENNNGISEQFIYQVK